MLALAAVVYGVTRFTAPNRTPFEPDDGESRTVEERRAPAENVAPLPTARTAIVAIEAIGDGADVTGPVPDGFGDRRLIVPSAADDGEVTGRDLRAALLAHADVRLRFNTEADREAFLTSRFVVHVPAYLPRTAPPGVGAADLLEAVRLAGFDVEFRPPLIRIGARREARPDEHR